MNAPLDEQYFEWLYAEVCSVRRRSPSQRYWNLFRILFTKEFLWFIPNDDNRAEDGKELRHEFLRSMGDDPEDADPHWLDEGCSMLELLLGLADRLSFETSRSKTKWFWELLENLGLHKYNDEIHIPRAEVEDVLDRVIYRTYSSDGLGGLFPLRDSTQDQRDVELWYQLSAYVLERY